MINDISAGLQTKKRKSKHRNKHWHLINLKKNDKEAQEWGYLRKQRVKL